jgi:ParB-like chromosome segregation protein Spo0J
LRSPIRRVRKSDVAHIREIANSIRAFGFNVPLLVGRDNIVLDGESRLEAARQLGLETVPCIRVDHLNPTEQRLLRLAVNRLAEKGTWDLEELKAEFNEMIIEDAPIELSGFGLDEVDHLVIGDNDEATEEGTLEPPAGRTAVARVGGFTLDHIDSSAATQATRMSFAA